MEDMEDLASPHYSAWLRKKASKRLNNDILGSPGVCINFLKAVKILVAPQHGKRPFSFSPYLDGTLSSLHRHSGPNR